MAFKTVVPKSREELMIRIAATYLLALVAAPDVREKLTSFALEVHTEPPECFGEILRRDIDKWGKLARDIGFKPR
jgi:tripartite-type tricarboxylate transporter receptor subunit TctC